MPARKQDYHAVLGLTSDANDDAIRAAYKKLALQWHPDRHLVGKERAAQMFIEVNQAYHALMDGKESTHSSSADTSSTTSAPDPTHSDTHPKSASQASSRSHSASSNSSKRSSPQSSNSSSSTPCDGHSTTRSKSSTQSRTPPSTSPSSHGSSDGQKPSSHPHPPKPSADGQQSGSDRMKSGHKFSKSHDHLRDPPPPAAQKIATPASTYSRASDGLGGSVRSKSSEKATSSSTSSTEMKHDTRSERTSCSGSGGSHTSKPVIPPPSGRLHKLPKLGLADEFVQKLSKGTPRGKKGRPDNLPRKQDPTPCGTPLHAINTPRGASKEWIFPLPLTLDEMYHGTFYRFLVTRELLEHQTEQMEISIDIPPGMHSGTRIVCPRTGHQRKDGSLQDVVFLVEEVPDERFSRVKDDLFLDVCVPWADPLADRGGELCIQGMDGEEITFTLPYPIHDKVTEGQVLVKGAGMPIREGLKTVGRGDMIVRWRVVFPSHQSKWQTLKKALHLDA